MNSTANTISPYFPIKQEMPSSSVYHMPPHQNTINCEKKKPGRKRKVKQEDGIESMNMPPNMIVKQEKITDHMKVKKKRDRFKGMSEEDVLKRTLPDHLSHDLDIIIVGINPGLTAAFVGHHYAGPGNHFWKCLFLSGLIPTQMNAYDDRKLLEHGIGFTNIVERTSRGSADLTRKEIKEGGEILKKKIQTYKPKIAVFNGKGIYEVFCGHKKFSFGKQPDPFPDTDTLMYVMPSSSARCTQLPRAIDKVPFYNALRKLRDHLRGKLPDLDFAEVVFPDLELKTAVKVKPEVKQESSESNNDIGQEAVSEQTSKPPPKKRGRKPKVKQELETVSYPVNFDYDCIVSQGMNTQHTLNSITQGAAWLQDIPNINENMSMSASHTMPSSSYTNMAANNGGAQIASTNMFGNDSYTFSNNSSQLVSNTQNHSVPNTANFPSMSTCNMQNMTGNVSYIVPGNSNQSVPYTQNHVVPRPGNNPSASSNMQGMHHHVMQYNHMNQGQFNGHYDGHAMAAFPVKQEQDSSQCGYGQQQHH